jgi:peptidoglycan-associated lipoprotein
MKRLITLALCVFALAACKTTAPAAPVIDAGPQPVQTSQPDANVGKIPQVQEPADDGIDGPMYGKLAERSIYFDLDSYVVKDQYRGMVEAHAGYLKSHPARKVILQGNADERGSSEYNLALGQKRSEAVKSMMRTLGVPENQLEAVSFGKERPKNPGHDETAWTENRRADISYRIIQ